MTSRRGSAFASLVALGAAVGLAFAAQPAMSSAVPTRVRVAFGTRGAPFRGPDPVRFYVAPDGDDASDGDLTRPVRTLARAVELTRTVERDVDKVIVFRDGRYHQNETVSLTASDWDLTLTAEHPGKAVLSGGVAVGGWKLDPEHEGLWVADIPLGDISTDIQYSLFCNGETRPVACFPPTGAIGYESNGSYNELVYVTNAVTAAARFDALDLRSAWVSVKQQWVTTLSRIATNDLAHHTFWLERNLNMAMGQYNSGFQLFNTIDGMSEPGSWMFSCAEGKIRYRPLPGETPDTMEAVMAALPCLIYARETRGLTVSGLVFEGCGRDYRFTSAYTLPHSAPLSFYYTVDTTVDGVEVRNCGYDGIAMTKPTRMTVRNCHVHDVGSSCVYFYDGGNGGAEVSGNTLHGFGKIVGSGVGVYTQASTSRIVGNIIYDGGGCGVTMWGDRMLFASNEIHHVMQTANDGGALYGAYNDSLVCDNFVHDLRGYPVLGLYCDEGGQRNLFTRNSTENVAWPTHMHSTQFVTVSNNVFRHTGTMTFSFQGSGHGVFCDNRIYQPTAAWVTTYYANCDFWGRNEVFVRRADGSYDSTGEVTATLPRPSVGTMPAKDIRGVVDATTGERLVPIGDGGQAALNFGRNWSEAQKYGNMVVGEGGQYANGVPFGIFYAAYDETYVYFGVRRLYNALMRYTGCVNLSNGGWRHCDALRIVFAQGLVVTLYPEGFGCEATESLGVGAGDYGHCTVSGAPTSVVRIRRDRLPFSDGSVGFNAMCWNEDLRELKMLYPAHDENDPSGVLTLER